MTKAKPPAAPEAVTFPVIRPGEAFRLTGEFHVFDQATGREVDPGSHVFVIVTTDPER